MKKTYTPAPWYAVNYGGWLHLQNSDYYDGKDILDQNKCSLAIANAQLASCAPDLLEALQKLVSDWEGVSDVFPNLLNEEAYMKAKEVIKKATEI